MIPSYVEVEVEVYFTIVLRNTYNLKVKIIIAYILIL